jgi:hypothetical protein
MAAAARSAFSPALPRRRRRRVGGRHLGVARGLTITRRGQREETVVQALYLLQVRLLVRLVLEALRARAKRQGEGVRK